MIEGTFSERQGQGVGLPEFNVAVHPAPTGQLSCNFDALRRKINSGHATAACRGNDTRATADAASQVQHVHSRINTSAVDMFARRFQAAPVELVERKEVLILRVLRVNTSLSEKCDHAIHSSTHAVPLSYYVGVVFHGLPPVLGLSKLTDQCISSVSDSVKTPSSPSQLALGRKSVASLLRPMACNRQHRTVGSNA